MAARVAKILDVPAAARMFLPEFRHRNSGTLERPSRQRCAIASRMWYLQPAMTTSNAHRIAAFVMPRA